MVILAKLQWTLSKANLFHLKKKKINQTTIFFLVISFSAQTQPDIQNELNNIKIIY